MRENAATAVEGRTLWRKSIKRAPWSPYTLYRIRLRLTNLRFSRKVPAKPRSYYLGFPSALRCTAPARHLSRQQYYLAVSNLSYYRAFTQWRPIPRIVHWPSSPKTSPFPFISSMPPAPGKLLSQPCNTTSSRYYALLHILVELPYQLHQAIPNSSSRARTSNYNSFACLESKT